MEGIVPTMGQHRGPGISEVGLALESNFGTLTASCFKVLAPETALTEKAEGALDLSKRELLRMLAILVCKAKYKYQGVIK